MTKAVKSLPLDVTGNISGQVTVTTATTAVQGPDVYNANGFYLRPKPTNTGVIYVGRSSGSVSATTGFALDYGDLILAQVTNLNQLFFDATVNGQTCCWLKA